MDFLKDLNSDFYSGPKWSSQRRIFLWFFLILFLWPIVELAEKENIYSS